MQNQDITMQQVAKNAGVSTATVSRALTHPEKVAEATRDRVERAMMTVGYIPQTITRHIRHRRCRQLLMITPEHGDAFFNEIICGAEAAAAARGYLLMVTSGHDQHHKRLLTLLRNGQFDGLLSSGSRHPLIKRLYEQLPLPPIVLISETASEWDLPTLHIDNMTAAFQTVRYLQQTGHRRIACISGPQALRQCQYRLQGYIQALQRDGICVEPRYIVAGEISVTAGSRALQQLMSLPYPPNAVFCHSDILALGVIRQAKKMGLHVPRDLSVVGFGDIEMARYSDPPLTTVSQPRLTMGREAVLLLLNRVTGKSPSQGSHLVDFELKIRGSTTLRPQKRLPATGNQPLC